MEGGITTSGNRGYPTTLVAGRSIEFAPSLPGHLEGLERYCGLHRGARQPAAQEAYLGYLSQRMLCECNGENQNALAVSALDTISDSGQPWSGIT